MRRLIQFLFIFNVLWNTNAQGVYFLTGSNFSSYQFKSAPNSMSTNLKSGTGTTLEMGFSKQLTSEHLHYNVGINLNEYNAVAGSLVNSYSWNTKHLGIHNSVDYAISLFGNVQLKIAAGLNLATIIYGRQEINGNYFDLIKQKEFSGISLSPYARLQMTYNITDLGFLSLGYGLNKTFFPMNDSAEKLSITSNQLVFGIHFNIQ
ncbi:MAG: hypothetical protein ORN53_07415 [Crocinitomicaceae bacterium]|jgi:hypothetical protein|nr:hypothetical protein [Crocinitomicaceae bacterium]